MPGKRIVAPQWEALLEALRKGNTRRAACAVAGIVPDTFYRRLLEDRTFSDAVTRAENEAEAFYAGMIQQAAGEDWRAAESWLKRRRREDWGDSLDLRKLTDDQIVRLLEREAAGGSDAAGPADPALANGHGKP